LRFSSFALPETRGRVAADEHGHPRPAWLSWSWRPLQSSSDHPGSALVASSAPATPFETASRCSPCNPTPEPKPGRRSRGVGLCLQSRTASRLPALRDRRDRLRGRADLSSPGSPLLGSCSLEHFDVGCPLSLPPRGRTVARTALPQQAGEGRQAFTGAVLRVLAPLDGSGRARGTHVSLPLLRADPAVRRGAPTLRGLVPCRSRPLESPFRAFPSRGAVPALAGPFSLAGSRRTAQQRGSVRGVRGPFRRSRRPLAAAGPKARRTEEAGTTVPWSR
jgi:hypothetical protein